MSIFLKLLNESIELASAVSTTPTASLTTEVVCFILGGKLLQEDGVVPQDELNTSSPEANYILFHK